MQPDVDFMELYLSTPTFLFMASEAARSTATALVANALWATTRSHELVDEVTADRHLRASMRAARAAMADLRAELRQRLPDLAG